jgi:aminomethyltransferase
MPDSTKQTSASLRHTPLYERHIAAGARMAPFAGWEMPISYVGINEEHAAVREGCGLFDVSHMGRLSVKGPRSMSFLDELLPREMSKLRSGQMAYSVLCTESGGVVDDLAVSKLRDDDYLLVVNASRVVEDTDVILALAAGQPGLRIEDRTLETGMLAVQGPRALEIAQHVLGTSDLDELGYFRCQELDFAGNTVLISRSGYTGEDGFEIVTKRTAAAALWDDVVTAGAVPCGLGARDTLRTEMGYCLYGHELAEDISPIEAGLKWTMDLDKAADFPGKKCLRAAAKDGRAQRLIGLQLKQRAIPRPGCSVMVSGDKVGQVTSGTFSPTLQKGIALAFVLERTLEAEQTFTVDIRGKLHEAEMVKPPFVRSNVKTRKKA